MLPTEAEMIPLNLFLIRKRKRWSQEKAAEMGKISRLALLKIENADGNPMTKTLLALAQGYGVPVTSFYESIQVPEGFLRTGYVRPDLSNRWVVLQSTLDLLQKYELIQELQRSLGKPSIQTLPHLTTDAEANARTLRSLLGYDHREPITDLPGHLWSAGIVTCPRAYSLATGIPDPCFGFQDKNGPAVIFLATRGFFL